MQQWFRRFYILFSQEDLLTNHPKSFFRLAVLTLAGVNIIWGTFFPFTKPALETIPPFTFALLRFGLAMAVILPLAGRQTLQLLRGPDRRRLALMGIFGFCLAQVATVMALKLSTASDLSIIVTSIPLCVALLARLWLGERLGRHGNLGFILALSGLAFILWPKSGEGARGYLRIVGDILFMVNTFGWAYYTTVGKQVVERYSPVAATAAAGLIGTLAIIPFAAFEWYSGQLPRFTLIGVASIVYSGLVITVVCFLALFWALRQVQATQAGIMMYLQPLTGVLIAWALLHEPLGVSFFIGASLVLAGVYLVTKPAHA